MGVLRLPTEPKVPKITTMQFFRIRVLHYIHFLDGIKFLKSSEFACVQYLRSVMLDYFIFSS